MRVRQRCLGSAVFFLAVLLKGIFLTVVAPAEAGFMFSTKNVVINNVAVEPEEPESLSQIARRLRDEGIRPLHRDGYPPSRWIVMDYNDVLIHIFHPELRQRYSLEDLWRDAKRVK